MKLECFRTCLASLTVLEWPNQSWNVFQNTERPGCQMVTAHVHYESMFPVCLSATTKKGKMPQKYLQNEKMNICAQVCSANKQCEESTYLFLSDTSTQTRKLKRDSLTTASHLLMLTQQTHTVLTCFWSIHFKLLCLFTSYRLCWYLIWGTCMRLIHLNEAFITCSCPRGEKGCVM